MNPMKTTFPCSSYKFFTRLFITFFLCSGFQSVSFSQSGWFWQNPLPQGSTLNSVKFINAQTGIAVGNFGAVLRTSDGGESWNLYNSNFINDIYSVAISDANNIFAVGSDGIIIKTTNSGLLWQKISIGINDTLKSVYFYDSNTGYITGYNGRIFKTTNGGSNWIEQSSGTTIKLNCVYFTDSEKGFIGGNGKILKTTNGGINWTVADFGSNINSFSFINANTGFLVGSVNNGVKDFRRTTNGGNTWLFHNTPGTKAFNDIMFVNSSTGFAAGNENTFLKTTNSGLNWVLDNTISSQYFALNSVYFLCSGVGLLCGTYGTLFKSTDFGNNWTLTSPSGTFENLYSVDFPSQNTGYVLNYPNYTGSSFFKTINGGSNWFKINTSINIFQVSFPNENTGYAKARDFSFYKSQNGGITWNELVTPSDSTINFQFVDANTGFIMNTFYPQELNKTTNGGVNWTSYSFYPDYIYNFQFPSHDIGFITVGYDTVSLYKTTNTGVNWNFVSDLIGDTINLGYRYLYFIDEFNGFIFSEYWKSFQSRIYYLNKTTDGGISWRQVYMESVDPNIFNYSNLRLYFANNSTGYLLGFKNKILKSTDQGESWNEYLNPDRAINGIEFTDENTGYMVGEGGMIMKTTNGGLVGVESFSSLVPSGFILNQNYPNPFNPSTVISYDLPYGDFVSLKVFDILGKEVLTLVNKKQTAGSYKVDFKAQGLPSGIYFYNLIVNGMSETKKMVLLK